MEHQFVVFDIANEHYGVQISSVESIIKLQPITSVPHAPECVVGVTNLRGVVLPVIDLRKRFGMPTEEDCKENRIVVVSMAGVEVGMIVDGVSEVLSVPEEAIEPVPPMVTTVDSTFLTGIAKVGSRLVILLDLDRVLALEEHAGVIALSGAA